MSDFLQTGPGQLAASTTDVGPRAAGLRRAGVVASSEPSSVVRVARLSLLHILIDTFKQTSNLHQHKESKELGQLQGMGEDDQSQCVEANVECAAGVASVVREPSAWQRGVDS